MTIVEAAPGITGGVDTHLDVCGCRPGPARRTARDGALRDQRRRLRGATDVLESFGDVTKIGIEGMGSMVWAVVLTCAAAAHRGRVKGRARGTDLLSGKIRCGLCRRLMAIDKNGDGSQALPLPPLGPGLRQPRRTNIGLHWAAVLGLRLIGDDVEPQAAIRRELEAGRNAGP